MDFGVNALSSSESIDIYQLSEDSNQQTNKSPRAVVVQGSARNSDPTKSDTLFSELEIKRMKTLPHPLQIIIGGYVGFNNEILTMLDKNEEIPDYLEYLAARLSNLDLSGTQLYNSHTVTLLKCHKNVEFLKMPETKVITSLEVPDSSIFVCPYSIKILKLIKSLEQLKLLDLSKWINSHQFHKTLITDATFQQLISGKKLTHLNVEGCETLTDRIIPDIVACSSLRYLNLSRCQQISDLALTQLECLPLLEHLELCYNDEITDKGIGYLDKIQTLVTLNIRGLTKVSDTGITEISKSPSLENLNISLCDQITTIEPLSNLKTLKSLDITGCTLISKEDILKLKDRVQIKESDD